MTDGEELYTRLTALLNSHDIKGIEVAHYPLVEPADNPHSPFLLHQASDLVLPYKPLLLAYVAASRHFATMPVELMDVTRVLLLHNAEHTTALNARRRHLLSLSDPSPAIREELRWTAVLLSIPSSSKSPSLWHHRRYLLARLHASYRSGPLLRHHLSSLPDEAREEELKLAKRAAELYPRNHAAYAHRSFLLASASPDQQERERRATSSWIDRHIADHSAVQHLDSLARKLGEEAREEERRQARELVVRYPTRETAWMMLRRCTSVEREEDRMMLARSLRCEEMGEEEARATRRHAVRATIWLLHQAGRLTFSRELAHEVLHHLDIRQETVDKLLALLYF